MKHRGVRIDNNPDKSVLISGYLYEYRGECYIVPWENAKIPANHMFLVWPDSIEAIS